MDHTHDPSPGETKRTVDSSTPKRRQWILQPSNTKQKTTVVQTAVVAIPQRTMCLNNRVLKQLMLINQGSFVTKRSTSWVPAMWCSILTTPRGTPKRSIQNGPSKVLDPRDAPGHSHWDSPSCSGHLVPRHRRLAFSPQAFVTRPAPRNSESITCVETFQIFLERLQTSKTTTCWRPQNTTVCQNVVPMGTTV